MSLSLLPPFSQSSAKLEIMKSFVGAVVVALSCSTVLAAPFPFDTTSTATSSCISQVQKFYDILTTYVSGVAAFSSMRRYDILSPVIESTDPTRALADGNYTAKHVIQTSNYANSGQSLTAGISASLAGSNAYVTANVNTFTVSTGGGAPSGCGATTFPTSASFSFTKTVGSTRCYIYVAKVPELCAASSNTTLASLVNGATLNSLTGSFWYFCSDTVTNAATSDSINFRSSVLSSITNATMASFCNLVSP